jgi:hypothetical protein
MARLIVVNEEDKRLEVVAFVKECQCGLKAKGSSILYAMVFRPLFDLLFLVTLYADLQ